MQEDIDEAVKAYKNALEYIPSEHVDVRAKVTHVSAVITRIRFNLTGNQEDILYAIHAHQLAISLTTKEDPEMAMRLGEYSTSLLCKPQQLRSADDLTDAISSLRSAIHITIEHETAATQGKKNLLDSPGPQPELGDLYRILGIALVTRYEELRKQDDLDEAVKAYQSALVHIPDEHVDARAEILHSSAVTMRIRFNLTGKREDIVNAIHAHQRAVSMTPEGDSELGIRLEEYSTSLLCQSQHGAQSTNSLNGAISSLRSAVVSSKLSHLSTLERRFFNLGLALTTRFQQTMKLDDIMEAIDYQKKAITLTDEAGRNTGTFVFMLGNSYYSLYQLTGSMNKLEEVILLQRRAISMLPDDNQNLIAGNLGLALLSRFLRTDDIADITEAIDLQRKAIELTPENEVSYGKFLDHLAQSYQHLFSFNDNMDHLTKAIEIQRQALEHATRYDTSELGERYCSLGVLLRLLFLKHPDDVNIIDECISSHQKAADTTPRSHFAYAHYLQSLGNAFHIRFDYFKDVNDIERGISLIREAIDISPSDSRRHSDWLRDLGRAYVCFVKFLGPSTGEERINQAMSSFKEGATHAYGNIHTRIKCTTDWTTFCFGYLDPSLHKEECIESVAIVFDLLPKVAWIGFDMNERQNQLVKLRELSCVAGNVALYFGKNELAFEWIEHARGITWSQLSNLRTPIDSLPARDGHLAEDVSRVSWQLEQAGEWRMNTNGTTTDEKLNEQQRIIQRQQLANDWESLLEKVREVDGFQDFLRPLKFNDLSQGIPESGFVVIINLAIVNKGSHALALKHGAKSVADIPLPDMTIERARELSGRLNKHLLSNGVRTRKGKPAKMPETNVIEEILSELWIKIMKPIVDGLHLLPSLDNPTRIWWCPVGPLAFVPLHAAGNYGKKSKGLGSALSDFIISSYIPTVTSLVNKMLTKPQQKFKGVLLVSQLNAPKLPPIPGAAKECDDLKKLCVSKGVECTYLEESASEVAAVSQAMENHSWVHLACHASQDADPAKSSFYLRDGELDLASISKKPLLNADFAFLSACQTSTGEAALSEESMHLAAGMYTAGYRSVIATMWSISDEYAPRIANGVYSHLLRGSETETGRILDSSGAAEALHRATRVLREELGEDKYLAWVPYVHIGV